MRVSIDKTNNGRIPLLRSSVVNEISFLFFELRIDRIRVYFMTDLDYESSCSKLLLKTMNTCFRLLVSREKSQEEILFH
jgi:hypothetical protein